MKDGETPATPDPGSPDTGTEPDYKADADKWKAMARKHEQQAKENADAARRLAEIEEAQKTEAEKATERLTATEKRAAAAELKALRLEVALAKGVPSDYQEFLTGDTLEELEAKADKLLALGARGESAPAEAKGDTPSRPKEALKSGATNANPADIQQLTRDDLKLMSPEEIVKAKEAGKVNALLGIK